MEIITQPQSLNMPASIIEPVEIDSPANSYGQDELAGSGNVSPEELLMVHIMNPEAASLIAGKKILLY